MKITGRFSKLGVLSLCSVLVLPALSRAQTETNVKELKKFANESRRAEAKLKVETTRTAKLLGLPMKEQLSNGIYREIYKFVNGMPIYRQTFNLGAAQSVNTSQLWPGGSLGLALTGLNIVLGEWDGGSARESHQEFGGRYINKDGGEVHFHSTHVAGTMIAQGIDPLAKGMSYEASINGYDWDFDSAEMTDEALRGLKLSNHSYGISDPFLSGMYDQNSLDRDKLSYFAPYYLIVQSAGNSQGFTVDGYDTLGLPAPAKNILTVGNVLKGTYAGPGSVQISDSSSFGPTDDGRIKPDIVTPGTNILSAWDTGDDDYDSISGTSMAAPCATGSLGLIVQYYGMLNDGKRIRAATLKALAIHTAEEAGSSDGPDYRFGWGLLNTAKIATKVQEATTNRCAIGEGILYTGETFTYKATSNGLNPIRVTLVWTDPPSTLATMPDDITPKLVNDLDLRVSVGGNTYLPWVMNPKNPSSAASPGDNTLDNVEQVIVPATAGECTITVSHKGIKLKPTGHQAYSLVIDGLPSPKLTGVSIAPDMVEGGKYGVGTVTLSGVAPAGGVWVDLSSSDRSLLRPVTKIQVPAGSTSAEFEYYAMPVDSRKPVTLTASNGGETFTQDVTVSPGGVFRLETSSPTVDGGSVLTGTVEIGVPAPKGGAVVRLAVDNTRAAGVAWSVPIAAGELEATFAISTYSVTKPTTVRLRAAYPGPTKYKTFTVTPPFSLYTLGLSSSSTKGGVAITGTVTMTKAAPSNTVVSLSSSLPSVASVPSTITVPAGATSASFTVTTYSVTSTKTVTISSSHSSTTKTAKLKVTK